jgi:hypothetical protein
MKLIGLLFVGFLFTIFTSAVTAKPSEENKRYKKSNETLVCKIVPKLCKFSTRGNGGGSEPPSRRGYGASSLGNGGGSEPPKPPKR